MALFGFPMARPARFCDQVSRLGFRWTRPLGSFLDSLDPFEAVHFLMPRFSSRCPCRVTPVRPVNHPLRQRNSKRAQSNVSPTATTSPDAPPGSFERCARKGTWWRRQPLQQQYYECPRPRRAIVPPPTGEGGPALFSSAAAAAAEQVQFWTALNCCCADSNGSAGQPPSGPSADSHRSRR